MTARRRTSAEITDTALLSARCPERMLSDMVDRLVREHFRQTPIALQVMQRTGVNPWPVRIERGRVTDPEVFPSATMPVYRYVERIAVVEDAR